MARGFGITREETYGEVQDIDDIDLDWFQKMSEVNFDLGDEAETDDGGSRTDVVAWAGAAKPNGSTSGTVDLQRLTWYFLGFLDQYAHSLEGNLHVHEFWGGENHELPSFMGMAVYDDLKLALFGLIEDGLKLEVSDSAMTVNVDWLYATETAEILGFNETFTEPPELINSKIPIRFYDVNVFLNGQKPGSVQTSFSMEGNNNHDQDGAIGLGSRFPQERPQAAKRTINLSLGTTLNRNSYRDILNARYGVVDAVSPSACRILTVPLELRIVQCENPDQSLIIKFPECTLKAEFDLKGADRVEATLNLQTLGAGQVTLEDGSVVSTDMYVKLVNNQNLDTINDILFYDNGREGSVNGGFLYNINYITATADVDGTTVVNSDTVEGRVYSANMPNTGSNTHDWEAPLIISGTILDSDGEVRLQLFENSESYASRTLEQLNLSDGGNFKIVYDGQTVNYYVNNGSEETYSVEKTFETPVEIRFYLQPGASVKYRNFKIYREIGGN